MCSALSCDSVGDICECIIVNADLLPLFTTTLNLDLLSTCVLYKLSSQRTRQVFVGGGRGDSDDGTDTELTSNNTAINNTH